MAEQGRQNVGRRGGGGGQLQKLLLAVTKKGHYFQHPKYDSRYIYRSNFFFFAEIIRWEFTYRFFRWLVLPTVPTSSAGPAAKPYVRL